MCHYTKKLFWHFFFPIVLFSIHLNQVTIARWHILLLYTKKLIKSVVWAIDGLKRIPTSVKDDLFHLSLHAGRLNYAICYLQFNCMQALSVKVSFSNTCKDKKSVARMCVQNVQKSITSASHMKTSNRIWQPRIFPRRNNKWQVK